MIEGFVSQLKQRFSDCSKQEWHDQLCNSNKLDMYLTFKTSLQKEKYLTCVSMYKHRVALTKLRCSAHSLGVETGRRRHANIERCHILCKFCECRNVFEVEDEYHFIAKCEMFNELRLKYLPSCIESFQSFIDIMSTQDPDTLCKVAAYTYHAFKLRDTQM